MVIYCNTWINSVEVEAIMVCFQLEMASLVHVPVGDGPSGVNEEVYVIMHVSGNDYIEGFL